MAVKTTKEQFNQDATFHGKVDIEGDVTLGKNAEVDGKLTINSASDLVTKDGTGFGGGEQTFESVTTNKLSINTESPASYANIQYYLYLPTDKMHPDDNNGFNIYIEDNNSKKQIPFFDISQRGNDLTLTIRKPQAYNDIYIVGGVRNSRAFISYFYGKDTGYSYSFPNNSGVIALTSDLNAKQSTLYRHTVKITAGGSATAMICFTAESEKNTVIDSIQDLVAVFGNTKIACSGASGDGQQAFDYLLTCINIGASISDTTLDSISPTETAGEQFTSVFGTSGFTITDSVTAM